MIYWLKRAKTNETQTAKQRRIEGVIVETGDRLYVVVESKSKYGLSTKYLAIKRCDNGNEVLLSNRSRSLDGAKKVCEQDARK